MTYGHRVVLREKQRDDEIRRSGTMSFSVNESLIFDVCLDGGDKIELTLPTNAVAALYEELLTRCQWQRGVSC